MKKLTLAVDGMKCEGCANAVDSALSGVGGVRRTDVSHEEGRAELVLDDEVSPEDLVAAVEDAGYSASTSVG